MGRQAEHLANRSVIHHNYDRLMAENVVAQ